MARYERSEGRGRRDDSSSRDSGRSERKFEDYVPRGRGSSRSKRGSSRDSGRDRDDSRGKRGSSNRNPHGRRGSDRGNFGRRDFEKTKVTCSECGCECEVPFKPTSDKPLFCDKCFKKNENSGSDDDINTNLTIIKQKLNKIMKALDIE